jgi:hypothetical protein
VFPPDPTGGRCARVSKVVPSGRNFDSRVITARPPNLYPHEPVPADGSRYTAATAPTLAGLLVVLALDSIVWILAICALSVVGLLVIVIAPWGRVRREPPLDEEVETRLLLGEDPVELDRELSARQEQASPVAELRTDEER